MSRKDTIIIAILVNAALLVALFVSAIKKDAAEPKLALASPVIKDPILEKPLELSKPDASTIKTASGDEVDMVLKEFAQNRPLNSGSEQQPVMSFTSTPNESQGSNALSSDPFASFNQSPVLMEGKKEHSGNMVEWTVKKGDALEKIARAHKTSVEEIMRVNGLKNSSLRVGQVLKIHAAKVSNPMASNASPVAAPAKETAPKYYTVKTGDNPWTIAVKNHMKVEELLKLNNLNQEKARRLKPGDELRIR